MRAGLGRGSWPRLPWPQSRVSVRGRQVGAWRGVEPEAARGMGVRSGRRRHLRAPREGTWRARRAEGIETAYLGRDWRRRRAETWAPDWGAPRHQRAGGWGVGRGRHQRPGRGPGAPEGDAEA